MKNLLIALVIFFYSCTTAKEPIELKPVSITLIEKKIKERYGYNQTLMYYYMGDNNVMYEIDYYLGDRSVLYVQK